MVPVVGAALTGVLSSGVTALYLRSTMPETFAMPGEQQLAPEQRHLAAFLVAPAGGFRPVQGRAYDPGADAGLGALGFTRGWIREWKGRANEHVTASILEFAEPAGAQSYAARFGRTAALLTRPRAFTVDGVPGASGLADTVAASDGMHTVLVQLQEGTRAVLLLLVLRSPDPGPPVVDYVQRQWAALRT